MVKMAGKSLSWISLVGLSCAAALQLEGCKADGDGGDTATSEYNPALVAELLSNVGPSVVIPTLDEFQVRLDSLDSALSAWESAIDSESDVDIAHAALSGARAFAKGGRTLGAPLACIEVDAARADRHGADRARERFATAAPMTALRRPSFLVSVSSTTPAAASSCAEATAASSPTAPS